MGCGGCGGVGFDPHAAARNGGVKYMGKGSTEGVIKAEQRLKDEAEGKETSVSDKKPKKHIRKDLPINIPESGVIKSKERLAREAKDEKDVSVPE